MSGLVLLSYLPPVCPSGSVSLGRSATHPPGPVGLGSPVAGQARPVWLGWPADACQPGAAAGVKEPGPRPLTGFLGHTGGLCPCCTTLWEFWCTAALLPFPRVIVGLTHLTSQHLKRKQISVCAVLKPLECGGACHAFVHAVWCRRTCYACMHTFTNFVLTTSANLLTNMKSSHQPVRLILVLFP